MDGNEDEGPLTLAVHEEHSQHRADKLSSQIDVKLKENTMHGKDEVKVENIFKPSHGGDGMGGMASAFLPFLAQRGPHDGFGGSGLGGAALGFVAGAVLGNRRGGIFGGDGGGDGVSALNNLQGTIDTNAILTKLGSIEAAVPLAAANTENVILQQTNALNSGMSSLALGTQQGFSNVKDSVQANSALNLAATSNVKDAVQNSLAISLNATQGVKDSVQNSTGLILQAICNNGKEIMAQAQAFQTANDTRLINAQAAEIIELRNEHSRRRDHDELNLKITNTNTAVAAQAQGQAQAQQQQQAQDISGLRFALNALIGDIQAVRQGQVIFNSGTMAASGTQAAANTRVN